MMQSILFPAIAFTAIVVALSAVVLAARAWLIPSGSVTVTVNRHRSLRVNAGTTLLAALSEQGIILPAACGGRGSCGQCRIRILHGADSVLPNEAAILDRREAAEGVRLACLRTVYDDIEVSVSAELLEAKRFVATVRSNRNVAPMLTELVLELGEGETMPFEAGEYLLLEAPPYTASFSDFDISPEYQTQWRNNGMFDLKSESSEPATRAYSLANAPNDGTTAVLLVRIATAPPHAPWGAPPGRVSSYIFSLKPHDQVTVSGPFGDFQASENESEMLMLAGGVGIAPIHSIIVDQLARGTQRKITLWYGARDARELCYEKEFNALMQRHENFDWHPVLSEPPPDSGWEGYTGFVHAVVQQEYLENHPEPETLEYYLCGPPVMSAAVLGMLDELGVERDSIFFDDFGSS